MTHTIEWFNNEIRFLKDEAASTPERRVSRCEQEPRLTVVVTDKDGRRYAVDGVIVEDQTAAGIVAALENFPKPGGE